MESNNKIWLAAYLYYSEPWEDLLKNAVGEFVKEALEIEGVDHYFFIRYWERGPHIRLRFKGEEKALNEILKPKLSEHFDKYFKEHPSKRNEPEYPADFPKDQIWYPNNTVQFIEYDPETDRYGGPVTTIISEKQFESSSIAVIDAITECDDWNYDRALGAGIQMHLGFAYALDIGLDRIGHYFKHFYDSWLHRAYYSYNEKLTKEEMKEREGVILQAFKDNFDNQKEMLVPYHQTIWSAFSENTIFEQEWLNKWLKDMRIIKKQLEEAQSNNDLIVADYYNIRTDINVPKEEQELWYLYHSYTHMINNRLGVMNRDEAFLCYLIMESVKEIVN